MKAILTCILLVSSISVYATNWLSYYVYYETTYMQGTWSRSELLKEYNYKYLAPVACEGLFGPLDKGLVTAMLDSLQKRSPHVYTWHYSLDIQNDTVKIRTSEPVANVSQVQNEITATLTLNSFKVVIFELNDTKVILTFHDLTLPILDLVGVEKSRERKSPQTLKETSDPLVMPKYDLKLVMKEEPSMVNWLVFSGVINLVLLGLLYVKGRK